jgi:hypothetical protein
MFLKFVSQGTSSEILPELAVLIHSAGRCGFGGISVPYPNINKKCNGRLKQIFVHVLPKSSFDMSKLIVYHLMIH